MNIRAEIPAVAPAGVAATRGGGVVVPLPQAGPRPLAEGFLVPVAERAAALFFDERPGASGRRRLAVEADGAPVSGPLVSTALPLRAGGCRHVVLLGQGADALVRRRMLLSLGTTPAAVIDPEWLRSPLVDVATLFEGLSEDGRQRLLRLFLTTGASLLGRGVAGFARATRDLLALLGVRRLEPLGWTRTGTAGRIVSYRLPDGFEAGRLGPLVTLTGAAMARIAGTPLTVEARRNGALLHVLVASTASEDAVIVATGPEPLALALPASRAPVAIERWLAARDAATRAWCGGLLDSAATSDPLAAAIVRELRHRDAPGPALAVEHLSGTPAGVVHAFRLTDAHGLVRAVRLVRGAESVTLEVEGRAGLAGYAPLPRASSIDDRCRVALVLHSGRTIAVAEGPLPAYDGAGLAAAGPQAVAAARLDRERFGRVLRSESFGEGAATPWLAVICPVSACPDLIATRAALVAAEAAGRGIEMVYHATEGTDAEAAHLLVARAAATFAIPHRLIVVTPDLDPAARLVAAVRAATAPTVLLLGAEVLPAEAGWISPWRRVSRRHPMLRAAVEGYDGRREAGAADCIGLLREAAVDAFAAAAPCETTAVLAAQAAEILARRGTPEARLGLVFRRYGDASVTAFEKAADDAALTLILKRSFSFACDQRTP